MGERIHIVLPDGAKDKLIKEAKKQNRSKSNLAMSLIIQGLSKCEDKK